MAVDAVGYEKYQEKILSDHEALCRRCGICCGAGNDPCANLKIDKDGRHYCDSYDGRLGEHLTVSGKKFTCVPIKEVLAYAPPSPDCGYAQAIGGKLKKILFLIIVLIAVSSYAAAEESGEKGLFSEGSFLSEAISSAADKLNKVTSGEEKIVDNDARGIDPDILEYDRDPLGRSKAALANDNFRNYRKSREDKRDGTGDER